MSRQPWTPDRSILLTVEQAADELTADATGDLSTDIGALYAYAYVAPRGGTARKVRSELIRRGKLRDATQAQRAMADAAEIS